MSMNTNKGRRAGSGGAYEWSCRDTETHIAVVKHEDDGKINRKRGYTIHSI